MPFLLNGTSFNVLSRMFPFGRGIFEDKVANFWCSTNLVLKWRNNFSQQQLGLMALGLTSVAIILPCIKCFTDRSEKQTLLSAFVVAMAFFLFSFQVHEKSILLPLVPALLLMDLDEPQGEWFGFAFWFALVSSLSMLPLYIKDGIAPTATFFHLFYGLVGALVRSDLVLKANFITLFSVTMCFALAISSSLLCFGVPPANLPDLYIVLHNLIAFGAFGIYFAYALIGQWTNELREAFAGKGHEKRD